MFVYRYENKEGYGPYSKSDLLKYNLGDILMTHNKNNKHPSSGYWHSSEQYRHGFRSIKKLRKWFSEKERKLLAKNGFIVNFYHVSEFLKEDQFQIVFDPAKAKLVKTLTEVEVETRKH